VTQSSSLPIGPKPLFRGGSTLIPRLGLDVLVDQNTGLLRTDRGVSVFAEVERVERFGGAYQVASMPAGLTIQQRGRDLSHYEILPAEPMTFERYATLLQQVVLCPIRDE